MHLRRGFTAGVCGRVTIRRVGGEALEAQP
jgi:hypothetical protein